MDATRAASGSVPAGLVGRPTQVVADGKAGPELAPNGAVKRKRGRPPRAQGKLPPAKKNKEEEEEEEDVCFICFDGGDLVLCDRKGCPKAYHPTCIKRDEAFFRSKAKWNCGWHICSQCLKGAHYMCYMCTYSLCKGCTKNADYVCVRGTKGFCATCMKIIMMIEAGEQGNKGTAQVDFDDKTSWEYLFKAYWLYLKEKLSLMMDELSQAQSPWKGAPMLAKGSWDVHSACDQRDHVLHRSLGSLRPNNLRRSTRKQELSNMNALSSEKMNFDESPQQTVNNFSYSKKGLHEKAAYFNGCREWASKELLEFVAQEKNGDTSALPQFEVQALLLDYIKRNNLCDPRMDSQILCDSRLKGLFGKPHLGHFEMLKLLESHFLVKENFQEYPIPGSVVDPNTHQVEVWGGNVNCEVAGKDVNGEGGLVNANGDEYATIDAGNINLIYLRRSMLANLVKNKEKFHNKVVGSVVRIKIFYDDREEERYRLVRVIGTINAAVPYKIGDKTVDVMLEVLNLDKREVISIDAISNEQFSEEECRHLSQSVKCGLVKWLTVGEFQKKASVLSSVRLDRRPETEIMDLNFLECKGSEEDLKKEHEEHADNENSDCLKMSKEYKRRPCESSHIVDKKMQPDYEAKNNIGEVDETGRGLLQGHVHADDAKEETKCFGSSSTGSKKISSADKIEDSHKVLENVIEGKGASMSNGHYIDSDELVMDDRNDKALLKSGSSLGVPSETSNTTLTAGNMPSETDKVWHYRDMHGEIQGPFAMFQLRKWSTSSSFPSDMKIWVRDSENDAVLLTDALNVQFHNPLLLLWNASLQTQEVGSGCDSKLCNSDVGGSSWKVNEEEPGHSHNTKDLIQSSPDAANNESQAVSCSSHGDSSKGTSFSSEQSQVHSPLPSSAHSDTSNVTPSRKETGHDDERWSSGLNHGNLKSQGMAVSQIAAETKENGSDNHDDSRQSSDVNLKLMDFCPSRLNSSSEFASLTKTSGSSEQNDRTDVLNVPSSARNSSNRNWGGEATIKQESASLNLLDLLGPTTKDSVKNQQGEVGENQSLLSNVIQDSGHGHGNFQSLVMSEAQLRGTEAELGGNSGTVPKTSLEVWHSNLISISSLKSTEAVCDHAAAQRGEQHTNSSPSQPASHVYTWSTIITEPIEFSTLAEESVSDLLAEVDAMEFQTDLASPTSRMRCIEELFHDPKSECFSPMEELSPPDHGKADAFSSSGDIPLPSQSTGVDDPINASQGNGRDPIKSSRHSITSAEMEAETKSSNVLVKTIHSCVHSTLGEDTISMKIGHGVDSKTTDTSWRAMQGNVNFDWDGSAQAMSLVGWGIGPVAAQGNVNMNHHTSVGLSANQHPASGGNSANHHPASGGSSGNSANHHPASGGNSTNHQPASGGSSVHLPGGSSVNHHHHPPSGGSSVNEHHSSGGTPTGSSGNQHHHASGGSSTNHHHTSGGSSTNHHHTSGGSSASHHHHASGGSSGMERQRRYGSGERSSSGPRDGGYHSVNSGSRSRASWSRQSYGDSGGGWHSRSPAKISKVCKYYESGRCRKGAMCDYLHP